MIYVIGNIAINISAQMNTPLELGENNNTASPPTLDLAGHGALQAISAARCGAKVSLISKTGTDILGKYALDILRKEGIQTSALNKDAQQGELNITLSTQKQVTRISNPENNSNWFPLIIPPEHFNARSLIVLSCDNNTNREFTNWLKNVRSNEARIMLGMRTNNRNLAPYADIIIRDETTPLPATSKNAYLITTKDFGTKGAQAQKGETIACTIEKEGDNGSETSLDIFCGYFAACLQASLPIEHSLKIACNAAALGAQKNGTYSAIPHLGYLEDIVEKPAKTQSG